MLVLGLDYETSGLSAETDRITEIGACLYDWDAKIPLMLQSDLIYQPEVELTPEIVEHTGITQDMLESYGVSESGAMAKLNSLIGMSSFVVAHFGNDFDRKFYRAACVRNDLEESKVEWIDTSCDVKYPERITTRNLRHLASEHGFLNPFAHRAVFDVLTMLTIAGQYNFEDIVTRSREPMVYVQAIVSFDEKELAKARGYRWCPGPKLWWKGFKSSDAEVERRECGFKTGLLASRPED